MLLRERSRLGGKREGVFVAAVRDILFLGALIGPG
jgi:hypothetical protein